MPSRRPPGRGPGLTRRGLPRLPRGFRGTVLRGEVAAARASLVSGPFRASPLAFVEPADVDDLARLVQWAGAHGVALTPRGGGTGMPGGNLGPSVIVSFSSEAFSRVEARRSASGEPVIRSGAGAAAARVDAAAREAGRFLPPLPASARWCAAGGLAANNAAGARTFRHGASAAWIAALEGLDASGDPFRCETGGEVRGPLAGPFAHVPALLGLEGEPDRADPLLARWPEVRKNSSGYALDRYLPARDPLQLLVGSEGTLVIFTAVEWRTAPLPPARGVAVLPSRAADDLVALATGARELGATACEFLGRRLIEMAALERDPLAGPVARTADSLVLLEVDGMPDEVDDKLRAAAALGRQVAGAGIARSGGAEVERLWTLRKGASPLIAREAARGRISTQFIEDSVVPVARLGDYITGLEAILAGAGFDAVVFGHAGDGNVHVNPLVDVVAPDWEPRVRRVLDEACALVAALGGTLAGEHGDGRLRAPFLERIWGAELAGAFRALKSHFDPQGILNPGVVVPLPGQDPLEGFVPRPRAHPPPPPDPAD